MSHAKREVGAACALLLFQRRIRDNRLSAAPLRACPRRSTWPITRRRGRSWANAVTRMGRGQVPTLLAGNTGKVFRRMGEGPGRAATGDARGVADEEARSRKATEGICGEVINAPCDSLRYRS
jgi:hypothetical protein